MDWDHLRFVLGVAEAGGLTQAARALHVDPATVSRRLDALEADLKCKLFHRTRRGLEPTSAGGKLIEHARRIDAEVRALSFELSPEDKGVAGTVVVTATDPLAAGLVMPALAEFHASHPGIAIEVVTDIRALDLGRREADIALRLLRPEGGDLKARRLGQVGYALYASPDYIKRHGTPDLERGCESHLLIDWPVDYGIIPQVPWLRQQAGRASVVLRANSAVVRRAAAVGGAGIALLPCIMAEDDPALLRIASPTAPAQELWLVTHRDLARVPRVRLTLEFLATTAKRAARRLEGR
jgi:DNA-binding transcriptional LysR family regulator